jgi:predicted Kef-type K+ transport protein
MTSNFLVIYWSFQKILEKKSVALATAVIVIKYAVLIGILTVLYLLGWRVNIGFALGLSVMFPVLGWAVRDFMKKRERNGSL